MGRHARYGATLPMSIIINYDQLANECLARCDELAGYSESPHGVTRRFLTPPMHDVHLAVGNWMRDAGMTTRRDALGNLIGTLASSRPNAKKLLLGSHLDTVPNAGKYDGVLGVMTSIAVVNSLGARTLPFDIDVIGFSEEEGVRFATPYLGSQAITGDFDPNWLDLTDSLGWTMRDAIESYGMSPDEINDAAYEPDRVLGFVEAHIEQGPVLSRARLPVAAVDFIAGQSRLMMIFHGHAGHAGTTPMSPRADALVAAARFIVAVSEYSRDVEGLRATVGFINATPNARNVICGDVRVSLDVRHADDEIRLEAVTDLCKLARQHGEAEDIAFTVTDREDQRAVAMNRDLTSVLSSAIQDAGHEAFTMLSGAGHDAVPMARRFPTAMLFIRQPNGISHHPDEDVTQSDIADAIHVLTCFVSRLARQG